MADIASDHRLLRQRLLPVLLRPVVVIMMHHGATAVVPQLRGGHRRAFEVAAEVFDAVPRPLRLFREVDFTVTSVLRLQVTLPLLFIADMPQSRQAAGINQVMAVTQQPDNRAAPDFLHHLLFEKQRPPDAVLNIQPAAGDGDVHMRMLIKLAAVGVQGAEDADFHAQPAGVPEHGPGGGAKEGIEQRPVVIEKGPQQMGHGKRDVLPVAVGQDMRQLRNPLLGGFKSATAAGF